MKPIANPWYENGQEKWNNHMDKVEMFVIIQWRWLSMKIFNQLLLIIYSFITLTTIYTF
jgi:hypothetical protein